MTEEEKREIRLNVSEQELLQLLGALSESNLTVLAAKINLAWLDEPKARAAKIQRNTQFAVGLTTIRARLFRLQGFLEAEADGFPRIPLTWVKEAIKALTSLQTMGE